MNEDVELNETFHLGEDKEETECFHLGGEEETESFHLGGEEETENFHLGGEEETESFQLGGEDSLDGGLHIDGEVFGVAGKSEDSSELDYTISDDGNSIIIDACDEAMDVVQNFISDKLATYGCDKKIMIKIRLAVEEIFVNIISYAYRPEIGKAEIFCEVTEVPLSVCIQFLDSGKPFDPLAKNDVDDSEALFVAQEGGFGIHLVKKIMDAVDYTYKDGKNVLTIHKKLTAE